MFGCGMAGRTALLAFVALLRVAEGKPPDNGQKGRRMTIQVGQLSFEAPVGLDDWTNYSFKDRNEREVLTVTRGARPQGVSDLRSLLAERRQGAQQLVPGRVFFENETDGGLGTWPARVVSLTFSDRQLKFREWWGVAFDTPQTYVQLSYLTPADDGNAKATFAHITASVASLAVAGDGYVRRWGGVFSLDVPTTLQPPMTYQFASDDETTRLQATAYGPSLRQGPEPTLEEEVAQDARRGAVTRPVYGKVKIGLQEAASVTYTLESERPDGDEKETRQRILLQLSKDVRVHLLGRATAERSPNLGEQLLGWANTFTLLK